MVSFSEDSYCFIRNLSSAKIGIYGDDSGEFMKFGLSGVALIAVI